MKPGPDLLPLSLLAILVITGILGGRALVARVAAWLDRVRTSRIELQDRRERGEAERSHQLRLAGIRRREQLDAAKLLERERAAATLHGGSRGY